MPHGLRLQTFRILLDRYLVDSLVGRLALFKISAYKGQDKYSENEYCTYISVSMEFDEMIAVFRCQTT